MSLVKCPECGREISDKAAVCPNCGAPVKKKYCQHCGEQIDFDCIICPKCGKRTGDLNPSERNIIINNSSNANANASSVVNVSNTLGGKAKNKWVAFLLCLFTFCGHKFYEGKIGMGILYLLTAGLFGIGWIIDLVSLLMKPNPYYV